MKNANELRKELSAVFDQLAKGALSAKDASELANIAGKMINIIRLTRCLHTPHRNGGILQVLLVKMKNSFSTC